MCEGGIFKESFWIEGQGEICQQYRPPKASDDVDGVPKKGD